MSGTASSSLVLILTCDVTAADRPGLPCPAAFLLAYKEPQRSQILDWMFKPDYGASLQILKVEVNPAPRILPLRSLAEQNPSMFPPPANCLFVIYDSFVARSRWAPMIRPPTAVKAATCGALTRSTATVSNKNP